MSHHTGAAASGFMCNERNLGGRKVIYDQFVNHLKALQNIKPTITQTLKPPKAHVDQGGAFFGENPIYTGIYKTGNTSLLSYKRQLPSEQALMNSYFGGQRKPSLNQKLQSSPEYSEVREAFKRVNQLKSGLVDNKKPKTYNLSKKLNDNRRRNMHDYEEHIKNLASLQRRLTSLGSVSFHKLYFLGLRQEKESI